SMLDKAINKAKTNDTSPLLSMTEEINEYNQLLFFEAAGQLSMNRTFWSSTAEQFYVVGVGSAYDLAANISSIEQMESNWKQLLNESIIRNPYECPGTGMLALGGMSFDPAAKRSQLWEKFSHLSFIIPEFMLTKTEDASYLTINIRVSKDNHTGQLAERINQTKNMLFDSTVHLPEGTDIEATEEIAPDEWKQTVKRATNSIKQHHADKIVLAREMQVKLSDQAKISPILNNLIETQTNSYVFAFERDGDCFIGSSPERLVRQEKDDVMSTCLAGTAPRGKTEKEDARIGNTLLHD